MNYLVLELILLHLADPGNYLKGHPIKLKKRPWQIMNSKDFIILKEVNRFL